MKKRKIIEICLSVLMCLPLITSCNSKDDANKGINPKQAKLADQQELAGVMGDLITGDYSGYLGYGYNVVTSAYFNSKDVSSRAEIFDTDKLLEAKRLRSLKLSHIDTALYMGETLETYQKDVAMNLGLSFSYGLFSKIKTDFSLSVDMNTSSMSNSVFIKQQIKIQKERQFIDYGDLEMEEMEEYVNKTFLKKLNADISSKKDEDKQTYYNEIFNKYGTHVLMDIMLGGRTDLNYVYNNTSNKTMTEIKSELDASYKGFSAKISGSASTDITTRAETFAKNSSFKASRVGGSITDINSFENTLNSYKEWAESIDNTESLEFFDVGSNCQDSLLPIWEFADSDKKRTEINKAYEQYVSQVGSFFEGIDKSIGKTPLTLYIKDFYIGIDAKESTAKSAIDGQIGLKDPNYLKKVIIPVDMNKGVSGDYVYIGYTMTDVSGEAITNVMLATSTQTPNKVNEYIPINRNLASKASGITNGIYLYYTKDKTQGEPIKELGVECDGVYTFGSMRNGWIPVTGFNTNAKVNIHASVPKAPGISLWLYR